MLREKLSRTFWGHDLIISVFKKKGKKSQLDCPKCAALFIATLRLLALVLLAWSILYVRREKKTFNLIIVKTVPYSASLSAK